jgi:mono/diheme cytochrome c family protein
MNYRLIAAAFILGLIQSLGAAQAQEMGDAKKGATLAESVCAACHAVAKGETRSPNAKAPTFTSVAATRGMTEMALRVWLQSPHPTMPNLMLGEDEKDDVIAYILSLKQK